MNCVLLKCQTFILKIELDFYNEFMEEMLCLLISNIMLVYNMW